jgi:hypothetical protein
MMNMVRIKLACTAIAAAVLLAAPVAARADGYSPLNLPDRGAGPAGVQGESTTSATPSPSSTTNASDKSTKELTSGTVQGVEDGNLIVEVDGKEQKVELPDDVRITRDGQEATLSDVASGDEASIERNDAGEITEVRIASQQSMNFWRGFLPILIVVLVGFYLLSRRTKRTSA